MSNDTYARRLAQASRWLNRLTDAVEASCDSDSSDDRVCHDFDRTDDGRCALAADLDELSKIIRGER